YLVVVDNPLRLLVDDGLAFEECLSRRRRRPRSRWFRRPAARLRGPGHARAFALSHRRHPEHVAEPGDAADPAADRTARALELSAHPRGVRKAAARLLR